MQVISYRSTESSHKAVSVRAVHQQTMLKIQQLPIQKFFNCKTACCF